MTNDDFDRLWSNLVDRYHRAGSFPLSEYEKHFLAVNLFRGSVPRSGFIGYFENRSGSEIAAAKEGLRRLGLEPVLAILEEAQEVIFGGKDIPADSTRMVVFPESLTEDEYDEASDRLDEALTPVSEKFYGHEEEMWDALLAYADAHELKPKN